jgi:hypothetical protein
MRARPIESPKHVATERAAGCVPRAILAGFAATLAMLLAFLMAYNLARAASAALPADAPSTGLARLWLHNLTHNRLIDAGRDDVYIAATIYLLGGLAWAILYALFAEPRLAGPGWVRGLTFSVVPTILSLVAFLPLVGGGMLGLALGAGPLPSIGNLLLHLVYGAALGALYGPFGDLDATTLRGRVDADSAAPRSPDLAAARGLHVGLVVGMAVGLGGVFLGGGRPDGTLLGQPVAALILMSTLIGAAFGSVVGSFLGLSEGNGSSG